MQFFNFYTFFLFGVTLQCSSGKYVVNSIYHRSLKKNSFSPIIYKNPTKLSSILIIPINAPTFFLPPLIIKSQYSIRWIYQQFQIKMTHKYFTGDIHSSVWSTWNDFSNWFTVRKICFWIQPDWMHSIDL